jgi:hypothetical protein
MARTSNLANIATVTRASKAWDDGWSGVSGGATGTLTEFASGVARVCPLGLLVEPASTNEVTNPRWENATVGTIGSGGVWPSPVSLIAAGGMTWTINSVGTENGWPYIDITVTGTASGDAALAFAGATTITAADGEDWTATLGIKVLAGTMPGSAAQAIYEATSGGSFVTATTRLFSADQAIDTSHRRYAYSHTLAGGGTVARAYPAFYISGPSGSVFCNFRLYAPQFENKDYSTSIVLPDVASPGASTRNADVITKSAEQAWYFNSARTIYASFTPRALTGTGFYWSLQDDANTYAAAFNNSGTLTVQEYNAAGTALCSFGSLGTLTAGTQRKVAYAYSNDDMAASADGATQATDSAGIQDSTLTDLYLGSFSGSLNFAPMYMEEFRFWPRRLANNELEALVGN